MIIEDDYRKPLKEMYDLFSSKTQECLNKDIKKIWSYFIYWCLFIILSFGLIAYTVIQNPFEESIDSWIQRAGSLVSLFAGFAEALFIFKLNKLIKVSHPAQLLPEIYLERSFKCHLNFSIIFTAVLLALGTITWGYGDLLYCYFFQEKLSVTAL